MSQCPVCLMGNATFSGLGGADGTEVACNTCGSFAFTLEAKTELDRMGKRLRAHVSGFLCEFSARRRGRGPLIPLLVTSLKHASGASGAVGLDDVIALCPRSVAFRLDALLQNLVSLSEYAGAQVTVKHDVQRSLGYAENATAFAFLLHQLEDDSLVRLDAPTDYEESVVTVTPKGWNRHSELEHGRVASEPLQGFIAMWMSAQRDEWEPGLRAGIERAGYEPFAIDQLEYIGPINDRIISEIRKSRFVVADFTGHRQNVYFEAGFAEGIGIPVFFTCREDQIKDLHFDKRQENTIPWNEWGELAERLHRRIEAVIGRPPAHVRP